MHILLRKIRYKLNIVLNIVLGVYESSNSKKGIC